MVVDPARSFPIDHCCSSRQRSSSRFWLIVWGLFIGICNIVLCGYIEIVEQQACHDSEFKLTCPSLDAHMAILEAVFTPANATNLILANNQSDLLDENLAGFTCSECYYLLSYPHTSAEKYKTDKRVVADNRSIEMNLRSPVNHRCSGVNHCSFRLNADYAESRSWGAGIIYIKYACMDESRLTKYCNTEIHAGEGFVQSPGYPHYYIGNSTCRWLIKAGHGQTIQLTLLDLSIRTVVDPYEPNCIDRFIIRDGDGGNTLLSTCEQMDEPQIFESKGETLDVYVTTNTVKLFPKRGILFHYKAFGCVTPHAPREGYLVWRLGEEAHYMCCVGHSFPGGLRYFTLKCLHNTWDSSLPPCLEKEFKIWDGNGTFVANRTMDTVAKDNPNEVFVDIVIPALLIAALFIANAVIVFVILKKRKKQDSETDEFFALAGDSEHRNGATLHENNVENLTNSV